MPLPVALLALSTASSPNILRQDEVAAAARSLLQDRFPGFDRMAPVYTTAGIGTRQSAMPIEWFLEPRSWPERTEIYLTIAVDLFVQAAQRALDEAGLTAREVDAIVTVSSTGIATPSLEARAMERMGFRPDAARVPVFGLGCAGGTTGLGLASKLARATPGSVVMLVVVELCTLSFRMDNLSKADIVATALFGDGAAACVLRTGEGGFARIKGAAEHTWPDTLNIMGWRVGDTGFGVIFDRAIPPFAKNHLRPAMEEMLAAQGLHIDDVDSMSWIGPDARACRRNRSWLHRQQRDAERNLILSVVILSLVTAQRLGELVLARRNTRRLLARGAVETSAGHYPFIVALHAAWLIGLWLLAWDRPLNLWLLAVFIGLQAAGAWVIASLGERWTTRIIILPDKPLVRRGPYRLVSHPNYLVVAAEISVLPLAFGLVWFALIFSLLNVAMMAVRISSEAEALRAS